MKKVILVSLLLFSLLLNAAGIVFFILFMSERGHYKNLRKEKDALVRNLDVATSGSRIAQALNSDVTQKRTFVSLRDGQLDFFAFQPPQLTANSLDYTLVVYLHGMGSTYLEPFVAAPGQSLPISAVLTHGNPRVGILSCNYRQEASWGNDAAVSDIIQNIREILQEFPFKTVVLMGTSMGGCVALNLSATAPADIKEKLAGVVAIEAGGDLATLWHSTENKLIRPAMMLAFGGAPDQVPQIYAKKSFLSNIDNLGHSVRIYMLSRKSDRVIPPEMQKAVISALNQRSIANHLDEEDGEHKAPEPQIYEKGLRFVLGENNI